MRLENLVLASAVEVLLEEVAGWRRKEILDRVQSRAENLVHDLESGAASADSRLERLPLLKSIFRSL
jgi:hypothetical protein